MTDKYVMGLLEAIDNGYNPTQKEVEKLSRKKHIKWHGLDKIPKSIYYLSSLSTLDLSNMSLPLFGHLSLPDTIGKLKNLKHLDVSNNRLKYLPECIGDLTGLQILKLKGCHIGSLPESIGNLENLQELDLFENDIFYLPKCIGNLKSLQILNLRHTKVKSLP